MKRLASLLIVLMVLLSITAVSAAATDKPGPTVRVNGHQVEFPDGKPYIDGNGRTMIPVRFVTEAMKAKVDWVQSTQTAVIQKDGTKVEVTIGQKDIKVTKNGVAATVTMDTEAVITGGRTYVPIRYVAEALGAYVAYSDAYGTVGIYNDVLTADEIETLRAYDYTWDGNGSRYEDFVAQYGDKYDMLYDPIRTTFDGNFENAHEFLYSKSAERENGYKRAFTGVIEPSSYTMEEFWDLVLEEAIATFNYQSDIVKVSFKADNSTMYMPKEQPNNIGIVVRGYATASRHSSDWLGTTDGDMCSLIGLNRLKNGETATIPIDVHLNMHSGVISLMKVIPLADPVYQ